MCIDVCWTLRWPRLLRAYTYAVTLKAGKARREALRDTLVLVVPGESISTETRSYNARYVCVPGGRLLMQYVYVYYYQVLARDKRGLHVI